MAKMSFSLEGSSNPNDASAAPVAVPAETPSTEASSAVSFTIPVKTSATAPVSISIEPTAKPVGVSVEPSVGVSVEPTAKPVSVSTEPSVEPLSLSVEQSTTPMSLSFEPTAKPISISTEQAAAPIAVSMESASGTTPGVSIEEAVKASAEASTPATKASIATPGMAPITVSVGTSVETPEEIATEAQAPAVSTTIDTPGLAETDTPGVAPKVIPAIAKTAKTAKTTKTTKTDKAIPEIAASPAKTTTSSAGKTKRKTSSKVRRVAIIVVAILLVGELFFLTFNAIAGGRADVNTDKVALISGQLNNNENRVIADIGYDPALNLQAIGPYLQSVNPSSLSPLSNNYLSKIGKGDDSKLVLVDEEAVGRVILHFDTAAFARHVA